MFSKTCKRKMEFIDVIIKIRYQIKSEEIFISSLFFFSFYICILA